MVEAYVSTVWRQGSLIYYNNNYYYYYYCNVTNGFHLCEIVRLAGSVFVE